MSSCLGTLGIPAPGWALPAQGPGCERGEMRMSSLWQPHTFLPFPQLDPSTARCAGPAIQAGPWSIPEPSHAQECRSSRIQAAWLAWALPFVLCHRVWSTELGMGAASAPGWGQVRCPGATGLGPCRVLGSVPRQIPAGWSCQGGIQAQIWGFWGLWAGGGMKQASKIKDTAPINH